MEYKFSSDTRYMTSGINEKIPPHIQHLIWRLIEIKQLETKLDYLQVFNFVMKDEVLIIKHHQEEPPFEDETEIASKDYHNLNGLKIYVIDDITHSTMLLASEY
jgi:hypothetical protein